MKISFSKIEVILVAILFLGALYLWTIPIQKNPMPFGDVDSSSHFTIGDYMVSKDHSIAKIPYPVTFRYKGQNNLLPDNLWYPPQYWTNAAIAQILGGQRILPVFILVAFLCLIIALSSYLLIRNLFGFWPAFLSSLLLVFSTRDYMIYLWGQWPQSLSYALTPAVLYCFYAYSKNYMENKNKPIHLYIMSILLAGQFFFHPQGLIASIGALATFLAILIVKWKKLPFKTSHLFLSILIFALVSAAFAPFNIGEFFYEMGGGDDSGSQRQIQLGKLFDWYHVKNDAGLPDFYFMYKTAHGSLKKPNGLLVWWTMPLLIFGTFFLAYRRKNEDCLILAWLVSYYFLTRLTAIGMGSRDIRMFAYEAHIFYPIIAIGLVSLGSFAPRERTRKYLKYGLIALFILLAIHVNGNSAYQVLKSQKNTIGRINPAQLESAEWIRSNLPEDAHIYDFGTAGYQNYAAKIKWLMALSQRHFIINDYEQNLTNYVYFDYTDAINTRDQNYVDLIMEIEKQFVNSTVLYNKNNIRVYKVDKFQI